MISVLRKFIDDEIKKLDPKFVSHFLHSTDENIGSIKYDKIYWLEFISCTTSYSSNSYLDSYEFEIQISAKGGNNPIKAHDDLWCFCLRFRDRLIANHKNVIENLRVNSLRYSPIFSNENWSRVLLSVNAEQNYLMRGVIL